MLNSQDMENFMNNNPLGKHDLLRSLQVDGVSSSPWSIEAQVGTKPGPFVSYLHPVLIPGGGGSELDAGNLLDVIQSQRYTASLLRVEVAAETIELVSLSRPEELTVGHLSRYGILLFGQ